MSLDNRFLEISFNQVFREITDSLNMDLDDMIVFFKKEKIEIDQNIITEWRKEKLPESRQFDSLIKYIEVKTSELNDVRSLKTIVKKLKEFIDRDTLIQIDSKRKLTGIADPVRFLIEVLIKAYDYQRENNSPRQQIENFVDFINNVERYQPKVFISYSWDSPWHKAKVKRFVDRLKRDHIKVIYDREMQFAQNINLFMDKIKNCDYVLVICTPHYKKKADKHLSGVGYENEIITKELENAENEDKFIPVLFKGDWKKSLPKWANNRLGVDLRPQAAADADSEERKLIKQLCKLTLSDD